MFSVGLGTQSTLFLLSSYKELREKSEVLEKLYTMYEGKPVYIYAKVAERPETLEYMKYLEDLGYMSNLTTIESKYGDMYEYYKNNHTIPFKVFRECTNFFKMTPIKKYARHVLKGHFKNPVGNILGITTDEIRRVRENKLKYLKNLFPFVELGMSRDDVLKVYDEIGIKRPVKSGCWFCPFQRKVDWINLKNNYPEYFQLAIELEENVIDKRPDSKYEPLLYRKGLRNL